jgi:hypothetical protein
MNKNIFIVSKLQKDEMGKNMLAMLLIAAYHSKMAS